MRILRRLLLVLIVAAAGVAAFFWWRVGVLTVEELRPGVHVISGVGGNVGVLATDDGVVVVDSMLTERQGRAIRTGLARLTDAPIVALLNTHYHLDHTHGNPAFPAGIDIVATEQTLGYMRTLDAAYWDDAPASDYLPTETFAKEWSLSVGGKTVRALRVGRGHTDGDLVVLFEEDRVLVAGDLFFHRHWPRIDLEAGGSARWWSHTVEQILGTLEFDVVIPGHGPPATRDDLAEFSTFMASLWRQTSTVAARGGSLADALAEVDVARWPRGRLWYYPVMSRSSAIGRAFEEATTLLANVRGAVDTSSAHENE
jgi:glyoxylase-like metal-dependent hydrolase (beta-lactamase superfamily II)